MKSTVVLAGAVLALSLAASSAVEAKSYTKQVKLRCDNPSANAPHKVVIWNRDDTLQGTPYPGVLKKGTKVYFYQNQFHASQLVPADVASGGNFVTATGVPQAVIKCHAYYTVCTLPPAPTPNSGC